MNGPDGVPKEQTYSFTYKNALFLMIDATSPIDAQTAWIEKQLATTKATWKIAMFHFAPYNREEPYLDIRKPGFHCSTNTMSTWFAVATSIITCAQNH